MSEPAEGWYPDPNGAPHLRWWDGQAWTDYVEPYMEPTSSAHAAPDPAPGEALASPGETDQLEHTPAPTPAAGDGATHASSPARVEPQPTRDEHAR